MNAQVTSREEILAQCRQLVMAQGMAAVNMRSVATACGVALGSLYNYFPSKADLVIATVESVWTDIFHHGEAAPTFHSFPQAVQWMFDSLRQGSARYPGFFTLHAMSFASREKEDGRRLMHKHFGRIRQQLLEALLRDSAVASDAFHAHCTPEDVVHLAFDAVIAATLQGRGDVAALMCLLKRALYPPAG